MIFYFKNGRIYFEFDENLIRMKIVIHLIDTDFEREYPMLHILSTTPTWRLSTTQTWIVCPP